MYARAPRTSTSTLPAVAATRPSLFNNGQTPLKWSGEAYSSWHPSDRKTAFPARNHRHHGDALAMRARAEVPGPAV